MRGPGKTRNGLLHGVRNGFHRDRSPPPKPVLRTQATAPSYVRRPPNLAMNRRQGTPRRRLSRSVRVNCRWCCCWCCSWPAAAWRGTFSIPASRSPSRKPRRRSPRRPYRCRPPCPSRWRLPPAARSRAGNARAAGAAGRAAARTVHSRSGKAPSAAPVNRPAPVAAEPAVQASTLRRCGAASSRADVHAPCTDQAARGAADQGGSETCTGNSPAAAAPVRNPRARISAAVASGRRRFGSGDVVRPAGT